MTIYRKPITFILLLLISNVCFAQTPPEEKARLAILDLVAKDVSAITASKASELIRTEIFKTGLFILIERNEMEAILQEQRLTFAGCMDEECSVKIGHLLSANKVLIGTVMKLDTKIIINIRIVDVEKGKLDFAEKATCTTFDELEGACENLGNKVSSRMAEIPHNTPVKKDDILKQKQLKQIRGKDGAEMVLIENGEFLMGSPVSEGDFDEHPQRKIYLNDYFIDKYEVTVAQFKKFCDVKGKNLPLQPSWSGENHPVVNVTWYEANEYAEYYGKRLPTEAEWEKAARAGTTDKYFFGDDIPKLTEYSWFEDNSHGVTHAIGQKNQINIIYMICMEMLENGVLIGIVNIIIEELRIKIR